MLFFLSFLFFIFADDDIYASDTYRLLKSIEWNAEDIIAIENDSRFIVESNDTMIKINTTKENLEEYTLEKFEEAFFLDSAEDHKRAMKQDEYADRFELEGQLFKTDNLQMRCKIVANELTSQMRLNSIHQSECSIIFPVDIN